MIGEFLDELRAQLGGDTPTVAVVMAPAPPGQLAPPTVYLVPDGRQPSTLGCPTADRWRAVATVPWHPEAADSAVADLDTITEALTKATAVTGTGWLRSEYAGKVIGAAGGPDAIVEIHYLLFG